MIKFDFIFALLINLLDFLRLLFEHDIDFAL
jgi:hypothetical protein